MAEPSAAEPRRGRGSQPQGPSAPGEADRMVKVLAPPPPPLSPFPLPHALRALPPSTPSLLKLVKVASSSALACLQIRT